MAAPPTAPASAPLTTLTRRADFLAAARARRQSRPGLTVQARRREATEGADGIRVGYTCSKKVGNAVARNRAKRRLRAAARAVIPGLGRAGLGLRADRPPRGHRRPALPAPLRRPRLGAGGAARQATA